MPLSLLYVPPTFGHEILGESTIKAEKKLTLATSPAKTEAAIAMWNNDEFVTSGQAEAAG